MERGTTALTPLEARPFRCDECGKTFKKKHHLLDHQIIHSGKPYRCTACQRKFLRPHELRRHAMTCVIRVLGTNHVYSERDIQRRSLTGTLPFEKVATGSDVTPLTSSEARPFRCDKCGSAFKRKQQLRYHQAVHGGKPYSCTACKSKFRRQLELRRHARNCGIHVLNTRRVHSDSDTQRRSPKDNLPSEKVSTETDITPLTSPEARPFRCDTCGKAFKRKHHLVDHQTIHNRKPYGCTVCHKRFLRPLGLHRHTMTCGIHELSTTHEHSEGGNQGRSLNSHGESSPDLEIIPRPENVKTDQVPFETVAMESDTTSSTSQKVRSFRCDKCGKAFDRIGHLQDHQAVHTGELLITNHVHPGGDNEGRSLNSHGENSTDLKIIPLLYNNVQKDRMNLYPSHVNSGGDSQGRSLNSHGESSQGLEITPLPQNNFQTDQVPFETMAMESDTISSSPEARPFRCDRCGKAFNKIGHLQDHQAVHTGELLRTSHAHPEGDNEGRSLNSHGENSIDLKIIPLPYNNVQKDRNNPYSSHVNSGGDSEGRSLNSHGESSQGLEITLVPQNSFQTDPAPFETIAMESDPTSSTSPEARPFRSDSCGKAFNKIGHLQDHQAVHTGKLLRTSHVHPGGDNEGRSLNSHGENSTNFKRIPLPYNNVQKDRNNPCSSHVNSGGDSEGRSLNSHGESSQGLEITLVPQNNFQTDPAPFETIAMESDPTSSTSPEARPFRCDKCGKAFTTKGHRQDHQAVHTGKPYGCTVCHMRFLCPLGLRRHAQTCGVRPFSKSRQHSEGENQGKSLNSDVESSPDIEKIHILSNNCPTDQVRFETMTRHGDMTRSASSKVRPFRCDKCGKAFKAKGHLQDHQAVHTGKPYGCTVCHRRFLRALQLRRHARTCGIHVSQLSTSHVPSEGDTQGGLLNAHRNSSPDLEITPLPVTDCQTEVPFETMPKESDTRSSTLPEARLFRCDICGKSFKRKGHLLKHQAVHCGIHDTNHVHSEGDTQGRSLNLHVESSPDIEKIHIPSNNCQTDQVPFETMARHGDMTRSTSSKARPFRYDKCGKAFKAKGHLQEHQAVHTGKPYGCTVCRRRFLRALELRRHARTCGIHIGQLSTSHVHSEGENEGRSLNSHGKNSTNIKIIPLPSNNVQEGKAPVETMAMESHKTSPTSSKARPFRCDKCGKAFKAKGHLQDHQAVHTGKPYGCTVCRKRFLRALQLRRHARTCGIHERQLSTSHVPSEGDTQGRLLNVHRNSSPDLEIIPLPDTACQTEVPFETMPKESDTTSSTSPEARPFRCDICGKAFKRKGHLLNHQAVHSGTHAIGTNHVHSEDDTQGRSFNSHGDSSTGPENDNVCCLCKRPFANFSRLVQHMLSHTGEKLYQCEICEKRFARKAYLTVHTRTHNHTCFPCGKKFTSKRELNNHYAWHTGDLLHRCRICGANFSSPSQFKAHALKHSKSKKF